MGKADLVNIENTAKGIDRLETDLAKAREQLRRDVAKARDAGETVSEIARRLGVTRARVYQMLDR